MKGDCIMEQIKQWERQRKIALGISIGFECIIIGCFSPDIVNEIIQHVPIEETIKSIVFVILLSLATFIPYIAMKSNLNKWIKEEGKILIYTTIHDKSEEGYYEKEDYSGNIIRFRKKFTEEELVEECNFEIVYKMYTEEPDRNKKWLTYIIKKQK